MRTSAALAFSAVIGLSAAALGQTASVRPATPAAPAASGHYVAIGCVARVMGTSGPASRFQITDARGDHPTVYRIDGDRALLERHVGHTVEVAGPVATAPGTARLTLKATSLVYIAASCTK